MTPSYLQVNVTNRQRIRVKGLVHTNLKNQTHHIFFFWKKPCTNPNKMKAKIYLKPQASCPSVRYFFTPSQILFSKSN